MSYMIFALVLWGSAVILLTSADEPEPEYVGYVNDTISGDRMAATGENAWENSGQFEGDIMIYKNKDELGVDMLKQFRNSINIRIDTWAKGIVPYRIKENHFSSEDIEIIKESMSVIGNVSCIRFRPYNKSDIHFIEFRSNRPGCWSFTGCKYGGQVLNLKTPGCINKVIIRHELLHALGFYHQHSTYDRDNHVKIHWENIKLDAKDHFDKFMEAELPTYDSEYDYNSIMHFRSKAFSNNGEDTITPLKPGIVLGGKSLTETDILKIQSTYRKECKLRKDED